MSDILNEQEKGTNASKTSKKPRKRTVKKASTKPKAATTKKTIKKEEYQDPFSAKPLFRILLVLVVLFGLIILLGGLSSFKQETPQEHVNSMTQNLLSKKADFVKFDGNMQFGMLFPSQLNSQPTINKITISGMTDFSDLSHIKELFDIKYDSKDSQGNAHFDVIMDNDVLYLNVHQLSLPQVKTDTFDASMYYDQWIQIDTANLFAQFGSAFPMIGYSENRIQEFREKHKDTKELFLVEKELGEDVVKGVDVKKYLVTLNPEKTKELLNDYYILLGLTKETLKPTDAEIDRIIQAINAAKVELWIGKEKPYLYRLISSMSNQGLEQVGISSMLMDFTYFDYDVPVNIMIPSSSITLESIVNSYIQKQTAKTSIRERLEKYTDYAQIVHEELELSCDDVSFLSEDEEISQVNLTPQLALDNEYALSIYVTESSDKLTADIISECQNEGEYIPVTNVLDKNTIMWIDSSFKKPEGPCGDILSAQQSGISDDMQACFDAVYELQVFMVERLQSTNNES